MMWRAIFVLFLSVCSLWAKPYKAVFDVTSSDPRFVLSRFMLLETTAEMLRENKDEPRFVIVIRGGTTPMAATTSAAYMDETTMPVIANLQKQLRLLNERYGADIRVCAIAMENFGITSEELLPFAKTTPNSFIDLIALQNDGFAAIGF